LTANIDNTGSGVVYEWGTGFTVGSNPMSPATTTANTRAVSLNAATTYWVRLKGTGTCGNAATDGVTTTIAVATAPTAPTGLSSNITAICNGISTSATLTASGGSTGSGAVYEWGTGATVGSNPLWPSITTANTYAVTLNTATTYWVRLKGTTACTATTAGVMTLIDVYSALTPGEITTASTTTKVYTDPNATVQNSTPALGGSGNVTYQWQRTGSNSATLTGADAFYSLNSDASNYEKEDTYYINRYAKDVTCNTAWEAATGTYTLIVAGPPGTITTTKCTQCCYSGLAWVDCYVSELMSSGKSWIGGGKDYIEGARSDRNGKANTEAIIAAVGTTGDGAVQLCNSIGRGWYLPAYEEMYTLSSGKANPSSNNLAGAKILTGSAHWTSTEHYANGGRFSTTTTSYQNFAVMIYSYGDFETTTKTGGGRNVRCAWRE
jgi:hypothetical protein